MINFDFEYCKPKTWAEAIKQYNNYRSQNKQVMYVAGATEFISRARMDEVNPEVIIDIKEIQECRVIHQQNSELIIGAAVTLTNVADSNVFPLLTKVVKQIATKTERNKITIGGNLMSNLPYKEGILPFLLADSKIVIATDKGLEKRSILQVFTDSINLRDGEFIVQIITDIEIIKQPFFTEKRTKQSSVNYPILTSAAIKVDGLTRVAFSGLCPYPFRLQQIENLVNDPSVKGEKRIQKIMKQLPAPIVEDMHATQKYRAFVFERIVSKIIEQMEAVS
ncbi:FAD binding domain-containing protein [Pseudogracilibacillus sp. SE30717A]|uniref:FAD binding domain-containing protein n=1 Tax=Pseudogracilibacillus sp. SE30717A TaxID=3098293 RepID=UPI00300DED4F